LVKSIGKLIISIVNLLEKSFITGLINNLVYTLYLSQRISSKLMAPLFIVN